MVIAVRYISLRKQRFSTSCWISASHFVLQYLEISVSLDTLHARFYNQDPNSASLMSGAGHPRKILKEYAFHAGYFPDSLSTNEASKEEFVKAIADNIRDNIPVIANIRSPQIDGSGHAVVITAIDPQHGTIWFKDPAIGTKQNVDLRKEEYERFVSGFVFQYSGGMQIHIWMYCTTITYLRPLSQTARSPS